MPTIDATQGLLVIRIVYDGPALSGKTTSLKALAQGVASKLECPEERDGRTVYFDWMEYVGGLFEGRQICCQIVSVPGQRELAALRKLLLESADAVVCVLDTRQAELDFGLTWLAELVPYCRAETPPIGVVLQANKRDAAGAAPREELGLRVREIAPIAIVESVATASDGIREAFVLAVRLALDRVRALASEGRLESGEPAERGASDLLAALREAEAKAEVTLVPTPSEAHADPLQLELDTPHPHAEPHAEDEPERLFVPDPLMPGGMIWPPVDGRALLHEVAGLAIKPARTARGDWWGSGAGWRFHSGPRALYSDQNAARSALIHWARLHAAAGALISSGRAVILADAGAGRLRLWQLVRVEPTLRERLDTALSASSAHEVADGLLEVGNQLLSAREAMAEAKAPFPCTLWTIGVPRRGRACFVGLMPMSDQNAETEPEGRALLERELTPHLRGLRRVRVDFAEIERELVARAQRSPGDGVLRCLTAILHAIA